MVDAIFVPVEAGVGNLTGIEEALVPVRGGAAGKREVCYGGTSLSARHASGTASTKGAPPRRTFYMHCTAGPNPASMERSSRPDAASPCKKVRCPCDKSMTSLQQNNDTRATKLRFCGSISPHGLIRTNPNRGFICHRSNAISRKWTLTAFFSRRISNSLHARLGKLQTMPATHAFRGLHNTRKNMT